MLKGTNKYAETDTLAYLDYYENDEWIGWCGLGICSDEKTIILHSVQIRGEYQNQGYGTKALTILKQIIETNNLDVSIQIKAHNIAAIKTVLSNGFVLVKNENNYNYYKNKKTLIK